MLMKRISRASTCAGTTGAAFTPSAHPFMDHEINMALNELAGTAAERWCAGTFVFSILLHILVEPPLGGEIHPRWSLVRPPSVGTLK